MTIKDQIDDLFDVVTKIKMKMTIENRRLLDQIRNVERKDTEVMQTLKKDDLLDHQRIENEKLEQERALMRNDFYGSKGISGFTDTKLRSRTLVRGHKSLKSES